MAKNMTNGIDIYTIIFAALALFLFFKLRATLGSKTGEEKPFNDFAAPQNPVAANQNEPVPLTEVKAAPFRWLGFAEENSQRAGVFDAIAKIDHAFSPQEFVTGAKGAYEFFTQAFARGDRGSLQPHLSKEVFEGFNEVITAREKARERHDFRFVSLDKTEITDVQINAQEAEITLLFVAQVVSATYDAEGKVIDGTPERVVEVRDLWTFAKDLTSKNPNWVLVGTDDED
jgi:predicted lipid-binding transport protein (Tim44 family)